MRFRERPREGHEGGRQGGGEGGDELSELRHQAEEFLAAGDEAIHRALSGDSEAFLRASRQHGGQ